MKKLTLVNGRVGENVNVVSNLHGDEVLRQVSRSVLAELLGEHVPRAGADSV